MVWFWSIFLYRQDWWSQGVSFGDWLVQHLLNSFGPIWVKSLGNGKLDNSLFQETSVNQFQDKVSSQKFGERGMARYVHVPNRPRKVWLSFVENKTRFWTLDDDWKDYVAQPNKFFGGWVMAVKKAFLRMKFLSCPKINLLYCLGLK